MNTETLLALADAIKIDIETTQVRELLSRIVNGLTNQINNPAEPSHPQEVSAALTTLRETLDSAPSNGFAPLWREYLAEMGAGDLLGRRLLVRVDEVFLRNQITQPVARDEIQQITSAVEALYNSVTNVVMGLTSLGFSAETLEPGEVQIGFVIPREFVHDDLRDLGNEFAQLANLIGPFSELVTGSREPVTVRTIASSSFTAIVTLLPEIAKVLTLAMAEIVRAYESVKQVRHIQELQRAAAMPAEFIDRLEDHATQQMNDALETIKTTLIADHGAQLRGEGREHEIEVEMTRSLKTLAYQYDHGLRVRVTVKPPEIVEGDGDESAAIDATSVYEEIAEAAKGLDQAELEGVPILSLDAPDESADSGEGVSETE